MEEYEYKGYAYQKPSREWAPSSEILWVFTSHTLRTKQNSYSHSLFKSSGSLILGGGGWEVTFCYHKGVPNPN